MVINNTEVDRTRTDSNGSLPSSKEFSILLEAGMSDSIRCNQRKWAAHDIRFINKSREGKGEKLWKKCWEISLPRSTTDITVVYCHLRRCVTFVSGCHVDVSRQRCMFHRNIHRIKIEVVKK
jgi:hypothetical protein